MPLYEYECRKCHHRFEVIQSVKDKPIKRCPVCRKGTVQKLLSSPALRFKGSGWYVTDYGAKSTSGSGEGGGEGSPAESSSGKNADGGKEKSEKAGKESGKPGKRPGKKD